MKSTTKKALEIIKQAEFERCEEIVVLIAVAKMTLTEINTLSDNERHLLSAWFKKQNDRECKSSKRN